MAKNNMVPLMTEYEKIEIEEVFSRTKAMDSLNIQIYTFFGTVNITTLGLGVSLQHAGMFLIAASMIGLLTLILRKMRKHQFYFYTRGLALEKKFSPEKNSALLKSYLEKSGYLSNSRLRRYWLPLLIFLFEIFLAIASFYYLKWTWF